MEHQRVCGRSNAAWLIALVGVACGGTVDSRPSDAGAVVDGGSFVDGGAPPDGGLSAARGFPEPWPWVSFYGAAAGNDLARIASTFRVINIDVDPTAGNFTDAQITTLKAGGRNRVISYLNVGACETYRVYFSRCQSSGALTTRYSPEYPDEWWANLSNAQYRALIVDEVAPRLHARGVDGFFLDNLEVVEHGADATVGPCDAACAQGGLDLVWALRARFPDALIVMQNATSDVTRLGHTHGVPFPSLLDGISHEQVYGPDADPGALSELRAYRDLRLTVNGRPFWIGTEDYVGACARAQRAQADAIYARALTDGFNAYVTDQSGAQQAPCFWGDL